MKTIDLIGPALDWAVARCEGHNVGVLTVEEQRCRFLSCLTSKEKTRDIEALSGIAANFKPQLCIIGPDGYKRTLCAEFPAALGDGPPRIHYSTSWLQAGPIIEREGIFPELTDVDRHNDGSCSFTKLFQARTPAQILDDDTGVFGPTPLIAAMRCYCCAKLGKEVDIPEELL